MRLADRISELWIIALFAASFACGIESESQEMDSSDEQASPIEECNHVSMDEQDTGHDPNLEMCCREPEDILNSSQKKTGFIRCSDGAINRRQAIPIEIRFPRNCMFPDPSEDDECRHDLNCETSERCVRHYSFAPEPGYCRCQSFCLEDDDCGESRICAPPGFIGRNEVGVCVSALCKTNADCPSGQCGLNQYSDGCQGEAQMTCRTEQDTCRTHQDCVEASSSTNTCFPETAESEWSCHSTDSCHEGRKLPQNNSSNHRPADDR